MISSEQVAAILKDKGVQLAGLASDPLRLDQAARIAHKALPIPLRWFVGLDRVKRLVTGLAERVRSSVGPAK
jgi:hypothetical protein